MHFFVWDGDKNKDFIKGIVGVWVPESCEDWTLTIHQGLTYSLPLSDELWDRHVRLASVDGGVFGESVS